MLKDRTDYHFMCGMYVLVSLVLVLLFTYSLRPIVMSEIFVPMILASCLIGLMLMFNDYISMRCIAGAIKAAGCVKLDLAAIDMIFGATISSF